MRVVEDQHAVLNSLKEHGLDVNLGEYASMNDEVVMCREANLDDIVRGMGG